MADLTHDMTAKQVREAAKTDPYMARAMFETDDWHPGAVLTIVVPVLVVIGLYLLFDWWFDVTTLSDKIEATRATVEALK